MRGKLLQYLVLFGCCELEVLMNENTNVFHSLFEYLFKWEASVL